jgi:diaminohydroxyphosphoribosylaminopyrimidine deaminase/5-amino-6-(5-phosphoribosylamino)uracil reductase
MSALDERLMRRAIELARRGFPAPNPRVGCVIASGERVVGEGHHDHAGGPHAEVVALREAGRLAMGATAYVSLEPCDHHGRTPPCSLALIEAGIARVVAAAPDPNPIAAGGAARLRSAGIAVEVGLLQSEAEAVNAVFHFAMRHRRPMVCVKAAITLDGRIAWPDGRSRWITGSEARRDGHRLRAEMGAVLVGRRTVEMDDPRLTVRNVPGVTNQPTRVVLDPSGALSRDRRVFTGPGRSLHVTGPDGPGDLRILTRSGTFRLSQLMSSLYQEGLIGLLIEGGARTISLFSSKDLIDVLELYIAPKSFGQGLSWLNESPAKLKKYSIKEVRRLGNDYCLSCTRIRH